MQLLWRVGMLGVFAAVGVGLAVSLALRGEKSLALLARSERPSAAVAASSRLPRAPLPPSPTPLVSQIPRIVAVARPAVADQVQAGPSPLGEALRWLRDAAQEPQELLAQASRALQSEGASQAPRATEDEDLDASDENGALMDEAPLPPPLEPERPVATPPRTEPADVPSEHTPTPSKPANTRSIEKTAQDDRLTINLRQADLREVFETLGEQGNLNILASPSVTGTITATFNGVDAYAALEVLVRNAGLALRRDGDFIVVGTPAEIAELRRSQERIGTRVYRPNYVTSEELQKLVTPLLTAGVGQATVSTSQTITSSPADKGIAPSSEDAGGNDFAGNDVLLIRDFESVLHYVDQLIVEVDQRPRQVCLEAMILSVRLDDEHKMGVNLDLLRGANNTRLVDGSPLAEVAEIDVTEGGLKFGVLRGDLGTFINALETVGDTNVIASPRLMCLNKQRAEILIGSQLGYVNTTVTETAATQAVQFLEVGTQLRFRPYIGNDDLIRLEVHPELSTGVVRLEQGLTLPDKEVTQVTTNVMCRDGNTVIIGGLIREDLTKSTNQLPVLGNLPLAGFLFRQKTEGIERREIIVLITPRIVREPQDYAEAEQAKFEFLARQANYADKMSPIGKRHWGMQHLRKARAAFNAGDLPTALRYVNLAIHFDPQCREATALHAEILEQLPPETDHVTNHLRQGLMPGHRPHQDYSREGYPWQGIAGEGLPLIPVEVEEEIALPKRVELQAPPEIVIEGAKP